MDYGTWNDGTSSTAANHGIFCEMPGCIVHESGLGQNRRDYWPVCQFLALSFWVRRLNPRFGESANPAVLQNLSTKTCVKLAFLKGKLGTFRGESPAEGHDTLTTVGNRNRGCSPPSIKSTNANRSYCV